MTDVCIAAPQGAGFISSITAYVDCQAQTLGVGGWAALAAPGSTLSVVLTGFLTIFIALIGYNLLLGNSMTVREGTLAFVKIGAVFALATSWPAYGTLIYDVMTYGPAQLVAEIGPRAGVVGSDGTLVQRLDITDQALTNLAILGTGNVGAGAPVAPSPFGGFDAFALGGSRILFLLTAIAGLAAVRIVAGLMLALGPFFIAFLMFGSTRSLFEGWVRVLAGAALAVIGISIALGLELALLEPWLSTVLARRMAGEAMPTVSVDLFVLVTLFTIVVLAALYACARVARAFRLPAVTRIVPMLTQQSGAGAPQPALWTESKRTVEAEAERSRAAAVASVIMAMNRRETFATLQTGAAFAGRQPTIVNRASEHAPAAVPIGRTFTRRATSRVSALANRRDATA